MAITQNPIIGRATGQAAGMIFSTVKGKNIIRAKAVSVKPSNTPRQVAQRAAMAAVVSIYGALRPVCQIGFRAYSSTRNAYNMFSSYALSNAFDFTDLEAVTFDPSALQIAKGSISPVAFEVTGSALGALTVTWPSAVTGANQSLTDVLYLAVIDQANNQVIVKEAVAARSVGTYSLDASDFTNASGTFTVLGFFASVTSALVSDSTFDEIVIA